jgi:G3E family GTPase
MKAQRLNPKARIVASSNHSSVNLKHILNTSVFSMEETETTAGWLHDLKGITIIHVPETLEYGISSFVSGHESPFLYSVCSNGCQVTFSWRAKRDTAPR